ncbi:unnamed protein product [Cuscuta europaea]|uniref:Uncharacterized protein n=1 Tax=Cuscuta europaea TaxID=41803 RepID=A0A9P1E5Y7_CUSEU|nr:unnamed protein product [Cuscuta europaea]
MNGESSVMLDSLTWGELGDVADGGPTPVTVLDTTSREDNEEGADQEALNDLSRSFFLDFFLDFLVCFRNKKGCLSNRQLVSAASVFVRKPHEVFCHLKNKCLK